MSACDYKIRGDIPARLHETASAQIALHQDDFNVSVGIALQADTLLEQPPIEHASRASLIDHVGKASDSGISKVLNRRI
jgi:hypothetical protein